MRISILTKLFAFVLVATNMVSAEEASNLRGPVLSATSDLRPKVTTADVSASSRSGHQGGIHGSEKDKEFPKFFPTEMTEEEIAVWKERASQKRQKKRDQRRSFDNPNRSQAEEDRERGRKTRQSRSRGSDRVDPMYRNLNDDGQYGRSRNARNDADCAFSGSGCGWRSAEQNCYDDCTRGGGNRGERCSRDCEEEFEKYHDIADSADEESAEYEYSLDHDASVDEDEGSAEYDEDSASEHEGSAENDEDSASDESSAESDPGVSIQ